MDISHLARALLRSAAPRAARALPLGFPLVTIEPGATVTIESPPVQRAFRPARVTLDMRPGPTEIRYFQRGVGGSRRRGRNASVRWGAQCLLDRGRLARLDVISIRVGVYEQLAYGAGFPASFLAHERIHIDTLREGQVIALTFRSREPARRIQLATAVHGTVA